jgi:hypothetical protein
MRTYMFSGNAGHEHSRLKELLNEQGLIPLNSRYSKNGILKRVPQKINLPSTYFLHVETLGDKAGFDHNSYHVKCHVHNLFDETSIENWTKKDLLHQRLSRFIARTFPLETFTYSEGIYVTRPSNLLCFAGKGIFFIDSKNAFENAKTFYRSEKQKLLKAKSSLRYYEVIISEYVTDPVLWKGKKCHVRLYGIISTGISFKISRFGSILTAGLPFKLEDFSNKLIHDTHGKTTERKIFYPEEFERQDLLDRVNLQLDELEIELGRLCDPKPYSQAETAYTVLGIDLMVRTNGEIVLIEINDRPGLQPLHDLADEEYERSCRMLDEWIWENIKHLFTS